MLPMLSTIFLREMPTHLAKSLLYEQYDFDSIDRVKVRYGHKSYVIKWRKAAMRLGSVSDTTLSRESGMQQDAVDIHETVDILDELDAPMIQLNEGCQFLFTDENVELIQAAFPEEVERFLREKVCFTSSSVYTGLRPHFLPLSFQPVSSK